MSDTSNNAQIYCGNYQEVFDNWGNVSVPFVALQNICTSAIRLVKASNGSLAVNVTYIDGYIPTETGATTSPPAVSTTSIMTGGELVLSLFSLILIFLVLAILIIAISTGIRIKETAKDFIHE